MADKAKEQYESFLYIDTHSHKRTRLPASPLDRSRMYNNNVMKFSSKVLSYVCAEWPIKGIRIVAYVLRTG
jgi:hypothetical protein